MGDHELLELAAKAIGLPVCGVAKLGSCPPHKAGGLLIVDGTLCQPVWNPLTDDADALRLMVRLDIYVMVVREEGKAVARVRNGLRTAYIALIQDDTEEAALAAARRSAVMAAAAIG